MRLVIISLLIMVFALGTVQAQSQENIKRLRDLDFSPFEDALASFTSARAEEINAIVVDATVPEVQAAVAAGKLTYEELTLYFLDRIRRYDDTLRSYIELNPRALLEAHSADVLRSEGKIQGPLHGIPVSLKDNIETSEPMHTTGGSEILMNYVPLKDAPLVKQLREGGAVILGKANMSEFAGAINILPPGQSAIAGVTHNPHGSQFSAGGSSSGSASATAG